MVTWLRMPPDKLSVLQTIERLKRAMPRNSDVDLVCQAASLWATAEAIDAGIARLP